MSQSSYSQSLGNLDFFSRWRNKFIFLRCLRVFFKVAPIFSTSTILEIYKDVSVTPYSVLVRMTCREIETSEHVFTLKTFCRSDGQRNAVSQGVCSSLPQSESFLTRTPTTFSRSVAKNTSFQSVILVSRCVLTN